MALKIRLRQQGRNNRQTYRLVVADIRSPRDGKYIEMLGWYNPFDEGNSSAVNVERITYWLSQGAQISEQAKSVIAQTAPEVTKDLQLQVNARRLKRSKQRKQTKKV